MSNLLRNSTINSIKRINPSIAGTANGAKTRFREQFQRSLKSCLKRRFSVEICFGQIFQETREAITLTEEEEAEIYPELLQWAKHWRK
jgi:hypothetical protein